MDFETDRAELAKEVMRIAAMTPEERRRNAANHGAAIWEYDTGYYFHSYQEYLDSDAWKAKAERTKYQRGEFCQICRSKKELNVHHNTYVNVGFENDEDLIVLCHVCHEIFHTHGRLQR